eukprot:3369319-Alexandrium_andersonii.AAC.1
MSDPPKGPKRKPGAEKDPQEIVLVSANVLSLEAHATARGGQNPMSHEAPTGRLRMLIRMAKDAKVHVVGIQEGRWPASAKFAVDGFTVIAAARDSQNGAGCQVWISNELPLSIAGQAQSRIPAEAIQPVLVESRMVAVEVASPTA